MSNKGWRKYQCTCQNCGKEFLGDKRTRRYCSTECAGNKLSKVKKTCLYCGNEFEVEKHRKQTAKWCNRKCYDRYRQLVPEFQPGYTGELPENPPILNRPRPVTVTNRRKAQRVGNRHIGDIYKCSGCGQDYILKAPKQHRCENCQEKHRKNRQHQRKKNERKARLEQGEFIYGYSSKPCEECGKDFIPKSWTQLICKDCRSKKKGAGYRLFPSEPCEVCGWKFNVNRHRINPGHNGGAYTLENVIFLCPNHHVALHNGLAYIDEDKNYIWTGGQDEK